MVVHVIPGLARTSDGPSSEWGGWVVLSWLLQKHDVEVGVGLVARTICHHVVLCLKVGRQQGVAAPADEFGNPSNTGSSRAVRWSDGGLWRLIF